MSTLKDVLKKKIVSKMYTVLETVLLKLLFLFVLIKRLFWKAEIVASSTWKPPNS